MAALFSDVFDMKEKLGEGAYRLVKRCVEKKTGSEFAVKMIMKKKTTERQLKDLENKARICRKLKNRNVVRLHRIFEGDDCHYFVFDLVEGGELFHDIVDRDVYSEADASYCAEWDSVSSAAKDLIHQMLTVDTAAHALKNQWICQRENVASVTYRQETVDCLNKFNAREKFKAAARVVMLAKLNPKRLKQILKKDGTQQKVISNSSNRVEESLSIKNGSKSPEDSKSLKDEEKVTKPTLSTDPNNTVTETSPHINRPQSSCINSTRSVNNSQVAVSTHSSNTTEEKSSIVNDSSPYINSSRLSTINRSRSVNNSHVAVSTRSSDREDDNSNRRQEIIRMTKKLIDAINIADFETYVQLCDPHTTAFQTETLTKLTDETNFQKFWFENVLTTNVKYKTTNTTISDPFVHLLGDEAACIAFVRLTHYTDKYGCACTHQSKETLVWHKRDGKWQNVHLHRSVMRV